MLLFKQTCEHGLRFFLKYYIHEDFFTFESIYCRLFISKSFSAYRVHQFRCHIHLGKHSRSTHPRVIMGRVLRSLLDMCHCFASILAELLWKSVRTWQIQSEGARVQNCTKSENSMVFVCLNLYTNVETLVD